MLKNPNLCTAIHIPLLQPVRSQYKVVVRTQLPSPENAVSPTCTHLLLGMSPSCLLQPANPPSMKALCKLIYAHRGLCFCMQHPVLPVLWLAAHCVERLLCKTWTEVTVLVLPVPDQVLANSLLLFQDPSPMLQMFMFPIYFFLS